MQVPNYRGNGYYNTALPRGNVLVDAYVPRTRDFITQGIIEFLANRQKNRNMDKERQMKLDDEARARQLKLEDDARARQYFLEDEARRRQNALEDRDYNRQNKLADRDYDRQIRLEDRDYDRKNKLADSAADLDNYLRRSRADADNQIRINDAKARAAQYGIDGQIRIADNAAKNQKDLYQFLISNGISPDASGLGGRASGKSVSTSSSSSSGAGIKEKPVTPSDISKAMRDKQEHVDRFGNDKIADMHQRNIDNLIYKLRLQNGEQPQGLDMSGLGGINLDGGNLSINYGNTASDTADISQLPVASDTVNLNQNNQQPDAVTRAAANMSPTQKVGFLEYLRRLMYGGANDDDLLKLF